MRAARARYGDQDQSAGGAQCQGGAGRQDLGQCTAAEDAEPLQDHEPGPLHRQHPTAFNQVISASTRASSPWA